MDRAQNPAGHTTTTSALLDALRSPDNHEVWWEFDRRYRPIVERFGMRLGLAAEDAADVAQQTLVEFSRDYAAGRYERERGRLRAWIIGIARHRALDLLRSRAKRRRQRGSSALVGLPEPELEHIWDEEREQAIFDRALQELWEHSRAAPRTLAVFKHVAIQGESPAEVARRFELSVDEVYRVKNRMTGRLRELVERLREEYE